MKIQSESEDRELMLRFATIVRKRHLVVPAIFALEMHKPFSFIIASFMTFMEPIILMFFKVPEYRRLTALAEKRDKVEYLIRCLEDNELYSRESESFRNNETECPHEPN